MLIMYKKPNLRGIGPITLKPGLNDVPAALWQEAQKTYGPSITRMLDDGLLEVLEGKAGDPLELADLAKLPERKAIKLVTETVDDGVLTQWHESERRKAVIAAIENQLARLADTAPSETNKDA